MFEFFKKNKSGDDADEDEDSVIRRSDRTIFLRGGTYNEKEEEEDFKKPKTGTRIINIEGGCYNEQIKGDTYNIN